MLLFSYFKTQICDIVVATTLALSRRIVCRRGCYTEALEMLIIKMLIALRQIMPVLPFSEITFSIELR